MWNESNGDMIPMFEFDFSGNVSTIRYRTPYVVLGPKSIFNKGTIAFATKTLLLQIHMFMLHNPCESALWQISEFFSSNRRYVYFIFFVSFRFWLSIARTHCTIYKCETNLCKVHVIFFRFIPMVIKLQYTNIMVNDWNCVVAPFGRICFANF